MNIIINLRSSILEDTKIDNYLQCYYKMKQHIVYGLYVLNKLKFLNIDFKKLLLHLKYFINADYLIKARHSGH